MPVGSECDVSPRMACRGDLAAADSVPASGRWFLGQKEHVSGVGQGLIEAGDEPKGGEVLAALQGADVADTAPAEAGELILGHAACEAGAAEARAERFENLVG
jgi:hypothetical protein